jgi:predicted small lipoprotein YifL
MVDARARMTATSEGRSFGALLLFVLTIAIGLAGCGRSAPAAPTSETPTPATQTSTQPDGDLLPPGPIRVAGVCVDRTGSTEGVLPMAKEILALSIPKFVSRPQGGLHLYIRPIDRNSWSPNDVLLTDGIGAVSPERNKPVKRGFESLKTFRAKMTEWERDHREIAAQQEKARADAADILRKVSRIRAAVTRDGSDISGCFAKFGDLEPKLDRARYLVVLSDLQRAGQQTTVPVRVQNTKVMLILYCGATRGQTGARCNAAKEYWHKKLKSSGAVDVRVEDATSAPFLDDAFDW